MKEIKVNRLLVYEMLIVVLLLMAMWFIWNLIGGYNSCVDQLNACNDVCMSMVESSRAYNLFDESIGTTLNFTYGG